MTARIEPPSAAELADLGKTMTRQQMADHYGVHIITIRRWLRAYRMTPGVRNAPVHIPANKLRALVDAGLSQKTIAKRIGCSIDVVAKELKRHGLRTNRQAYLAECEQKRLQAVSYVRPTAAAILAANPFGLGHSSNF